MVEGFEYLKNYSPGAGQFYFKLGSVFKLFLDIYIYQQKRKSRVSYWVLGRNSITMYAFFTKYVSTVHREFRREIKSAPSNSKENIVWKHCQKGRGLVSFRLSGVTCRIGSCVVPASTLFTSIIYTKVLW